MNSSREVLNIGGHRYYCPSWGERGFGRFLDWGIAIIIFITGILTGALSSSLEESILPQVGALASGAYILLAEGMGHGQSLGKRALKMAVIDAESGARCGYRQSFSRNITILVISTVEVLFIVFGRSDEKRQRLGDLLAGTVVVSTDPVP
jgi:Predicted membrane protein/domain